MSGPGVETPGYCQKSLAGLILVPSLGYSKVSFDGQWLCRYISVMWGSKLLWFLIPAASCLMVPSVLWPFATWTTMSPQGSGDFEFEVGLLFIFCGLVAVAIAAISALCLLFRRLRLIALICLTSAFSFVAGLVVGGNASRYVWTNALSRFTERSQPLVLAIKSYEQKYGRPPDSLDALVPEFIAKVPVTGIGASREYQYESLTNNSAYGRNRWVLYINSPSASPLSFDCLLYLPLQDYRVLDKEHDRVRKIRDWGYWHRG